MEQFKTSLVISTYNWPEALELCLKSSLRQTVAPAEILVADDGSDERTAQLIARYRAQTSIPIVHVWQEDTGFRVGSIRNKAIARATGAYIIQVDGDVILHPDFVRDHVSIARPGRFVSGSRVLLGPRYSAGLLANRSIDINAWKKDVSNRLNAIRIPWASPVFGRYKPEVTRGCNMAFWRDDAICVNGYNELILGQRGLRIRQPAVAHRRAALLAQTFGHRLSYLPQRPSPRPGCRQSGIGQPHAQSASAALQTGHFAISLSRSRNDDTGQRGAGVAPHTDHFAAGMIPRHARRMRRFVQL